MGKPSFCLQDFCVVIFKAVLRRVSLASSVSCLGEFEFLSSSLNRGRSSSLDIRNKGLTQWMVPKILKIIWSIDGHSQS